MPNINKANRQVCDVDIRILSNKKPFLFFDTANTTTTGLTSEDTYAMAKGAKKIAFSNPMDGTLTIESQVFPFKFYSLLSDGTIKDEAILPVRTTITCATAGELDIPAGANVGTVFVFDYGEFGEKEIVGTVASDKFTATTADDIVVGERYEVGYFETKTTGVQRISFNNHDLPKDFFITMETIEKDEDGLITPYKIVAYKAKPKRNLNLSFSSSGDPVSVTMEFSLMEDKDGNVVDMVEILD